jgi:hypothetical protein
MLVGYAAGVGFCASIAVILAAYTWCTHGPKRARADSGQPVASKTAPAEDVAIPPEHAAVPIAKAGRLPSSDTQVEKEQIARPRIEKSPPVDVAGGNPKLSSPPPIAQPERPSALPKPSERLVSCGTDQFALSPGAVATAAPFVLPEKPWFALADLTLAEPESCSGAATVCSANRSLDTALTWAKSPAEAAAEASREGKLVFLIHVSGNFEDPGFT